MRVVGAEQINERAVESSQAKSSQVEPSRVERRTHKRTHELATARAYKRDRKYQSVQVKRRVGELGAKVKPSERASELDDEC